MRRRSRTSRAAPTACRSCSPARSAPMASASGDPIRRRSPPPSKAFNSTRDPRSSSTSARTGRPKRSPSPRMYGHRGRAVDLPRLVWPRSVRRRGARSVSVRLGWLRQAVCRRGARTQGRRLPRTVPRRRRAQRACGWRFGGPGARLRARGGRQSDARAWASRRRARRSPRHDRLPARLRRRGIHRARQVPGAAHRLGAGRGGLRPRAARRPRPGRERLADDDPARPVPERAARIDRRVFGRPRRRRQRRRAAAPARRRIARRASRGGSRATASSSSCANPTSASSRTRPPARAVSRR